LKTIRREDTKTSLDINIGSSGEVIRRHSFPDASGEAVANRMVRGEAVQPSAFQQHDVCDEPFILGKANAEKTTCSNAHHSEILEEEDCKLAAQQADAKWTKDFVVTEAGGWREIRPRGCFMMPCRYNETHHNNGKVIGDDEGMLEGTCYFYNPIGPDPKGPIEGTAVCYGTMFYLGENDTNGKLEGECPEGYETILHEDPCEEAAKCLDDCLGWDTIKNNKNASKYDDYPLGCMIDHWDGCVYFNRPVEGKAPPADPKGVPICKIAKITHFPNDMPTARL
jgi:hypothetical protein